MSLQYKSYKSSPSPVFVPEQKDDCKGWFSQLLYSFEMTKTSTKPDNSVLKQVVVFRPSVKLNWSSLFSK